MTVWNNVPLSRAANLIMGQSPDSRFYNAEGQGLPFLQGCAQFGQTHPVTDVYCSQPTKRASKGATLFSVRAPVGAINAADQIYCIGRGVAAIVARDMDNEYLRYYLRSLSGEFERLSQGSTFSAINSTALGNILIKRPSTQREQAKIAEVLAAVDHVITQTESLIAKYRRVKTGLMHDLLTRGIDAQGQLRDPATHAFQPSPLGIIPAEWQVANLASVASRITSGSRGWASYYAEEGAKFIRIGNLTRNHVHLRWNDVQHVRPPSGSEGKRTFLEPGDMLISITADLGMIGVVPQDIGEAYINQHIALIKLKRDLVVPEFVGNLLAGKSAQSKFSEMNESGAKAGLNLPAIAAFPIVLPELSEQNQIANVIKQADDTIFIEQAQLAKLRKVKTGLMQDLLTGRVPITPLLDNVNIDDASIQTVSANAVPGVENSV